MFTFKRKTSQQPSSIFINGLTCVTTSTMTVQSVWQQRHTISAIGDILSKAINDPSNPVDAAFLEYAATHALTMPQYAPFHKLTFDPHVGVSGNVWHHGEFYLPAIKGMPERILEHCDMSENERESITTQLHAMSATGDMVVAIATGLLRHPIKDLRDLKNNEKLSFIGFASVQMTASTDIRRFLSHTSKRIYLATGQHPAATLAVVKQLGLTATPGDVFDSRRLDVMNAADIKTTVASVHIFARATPERKDHILDAVKAIDPTTVQVTTLADLQKLLAN